ncbi:MAG: amidohydrolase family protein [Planctomycetes bacterium]|nr:amidohydrolase family protein [Planctomycetota bacterium]
MFRTFALWIVLLFPLGVSAQELRPPGARPEPPGVHALTNARVVTAPGKVVDPGTVILRDGLIVAVGGPEVAVPADARVWDLKGHTVYAGFIEAYLVIEGAEPKPERPRGESPRAADTGFHGAPGTQPDPGAPGPGAALAAIVPEKRAAATYAPDPKLIEALREQGFAAANVAPAAGVLRGTGVFVLLLEGDPNRAILRADTFQHASLAGGGGGDWENETYPDSLMARLAAIRQTFLDADWYARDQAHYQRMAKFRKRPAHDPSLEALGSVLRGETTLLIEVESALQVDFAARVAKEFGVKFAIRASGQEWRRSDVAKEAGAAMVVPVNYPVAPKLEEDDDWTQVSLDQLRAWDWAPEDAAVLRAQGLDVALTMHGLGDRGAFRKNVRAAIDRGLTEDDALAALTTVPARLCGVSERTGTIEAGKIANLTIVEGSYFDPKSRIAAVWVDGRPFQVKPGEAAKPKEGEDEKRKKKEEEEARGLAASRTARSPQEGRGWTEAPEAIMVRGATVWTCGPQGRLENADVLFSDGKVRAVGKDLAAPADALVIDGKGLHVTPGLLDCHSHMAIVGDVNEGTIPSSAMVRIGDVVNSETDNIYQELAGGLTCANLLHGSANPIGGQNCVIKLRDGAPPEGLKFREAIPGIKFALGENVKQSNWGEKFTTRFPQTRMGVRTFVANRFTAARQYLAAWEFFNREQKSGEEKQPVRRDLELEALGEILEAKRLIHCHSYRADEILMLVRLMEGLGVRIGTFQHVLEGYKVADEVAKHGAGGSCFSDWWAYKFEVYDAIPYAGALMRERGMLVSFNSDSSELARRMYLEAAKAVKYGGVPEEEALKFVTLNPAKQLRVDAWVGSLEPGKHADFAIWSGSPLDSGTVCLQTWIEGRKYFDRSKDAARTEARRKEWEALRDKAKKMPQGGPGGRDKEGEKKFWESSLELRYDHGWEVDCMGAHCIEEGRK